MKNFTAILALTLAAHDASSLHATVITAIPGPDDLAPGTYSATFEVFIANATFTAGTRFADDTPAALSATQDMNYGTTTINQRFFGTRVLPGGDPASFWWAGFPKESGRRPIATIKPSTYLSFPRERGPEMSTENHIFRAHSEP